MPDGGTAADVRAALAEYADPVRAAHSARYFKTGPGEYGEGDVFLGATMPQQRAVARRFRDLPHGEAATLLASEVHEHRMTALLVLVDRYGRGDDRERDAIYRLYLASTARVNGWDLVDASAARIVGAHTAAQGVGPLLPLARSASVWERRIAAVACFDDLGRGDSSRPLEVATLLAHDEHDLVRKAVGWLLRETGKRCGREVLVGWLLAEGGRYRTLPRTELRYAIEHFGAEERRAYLAGTA